MFYGLEKGRKARGDGTGLTEKEKGNRRLILNMVTKTRNLIVKSITAGRG